MFACIAAAATNGRKFVWGRCVCGRIRLTCALKCARNARPLPGWRVYYGVRSPRRVGPARLRLYKTVRRQTLGAFMRAEGWDDDGFGSCACARACFDDVAINKARSGECRGPVARASGHSTPDIVHFVTNIIYAVCQSPPPPPPPPPDIMALVFGGSLVRNLCTLIRSASNSTVVSLAINQSRGLCAGTIFRPLTARRPLFAAARADSGRSWFANLANTRAC